MARKQKVRGNGIVAGQLRGFVARLERLAEERAQLSDDTKAVMAEAKAHGYDTKIIRLLLRERRRDESEIAEEEEMLRLYRDAMGIEGTPLAEWAKTLDEGEVAISPESKRRAKRKGKEAAAPDMPTDDEVAAAQGITTLDAVTRANIEKARAIRASETEARPT